MARADLVIFGNILTVNDDHPTAEGVAVADGRIVAVGERTEVEKWIEDGYTDIRKLEGGACLMPGLIEAHGHPVMESIVLSDRMVDIRPVTIPNADDVVRAINAEVAKRGAEGAYLNGWDPLLQTGLPDPDLTWLNETGQGHPLVIVHNSGHLAYFNTAAAENAGITRDSVAPPGSSYGIDPVTHDLDGTAEEAPAVFTVLQPVMSQLDKAAAMLAECARLNRAGLTACSEMAFDPQFRPLLDALHDQLTVRLRPYEMSTAALHTDADPDNGDDMVHQPGIKLWLDGSPWIGNIDLTFAYLDTPATQNMGVQNSCGKANYTKDELLAIVRAYFPKGWQMACHVHGDHGVDTILDVYEQVLAEYPRDDHRLRLEHVGAITAEQLKRAHDLGVTCSMLVDHLHYWGDVLVDDLFGEDHGSHWVRAASAVNTGMRISLHNDPPVTPEEPLRNMSVAITRKSPSGKTLAPEEALTIDQAIRAQTIDAAWQLFADDIIGSLEVGKYADMVVLSADPHDVDPDKVADITVLATFLAGREVYAAPRLTQVSRADVPERLNERVLL